MPPKKKIDFLVQNIDGFSQTIHKVFTIHKTLQAKPIREIAKTKKF